MRTQLLNQIASVNSELRDAFVSVESFINNNVPSGQPLSEYTAALERGLELFIKFYTDPNRLYLVNGYILAISGYVQVHEAYPEAVPPLLPSENSPLAVLDRGNFIGTFVHANPVVWIDAASAGTALNTFFDDFETQLEQAGGNLARFANALHAKTSALLTWQSFEELEANASFNNDTVRDFIFNNLGWNEFIRGQGLHAQGIYSFPRDENFEIGVLDPIDIPTDDPAFNPSVYLQYIRTGDIPFFVRDGHFRLRFAPSETGFISWDVGTVSFMNTANRFDSLPINAGEATFTGETIYICYAPNIEDLIVTTNPNTAYLNGQTIVAIYNGNFDLQVFNATRIILGTDIALDSLPPDRISEGDLLSNIRIGQDSSLVLDSERKQIRLGPAVAPKVSIGQHTETGFSSESGWLFRDNTGKVFMDSIRGLGENTVSSKNIQPGAIQEFHLYFGARSIDPIGINITVDAVNNRVQWTSGVLSWFDDVGNNIETQILAGQAIYVDRPLFIMWERGADRFFSTSDTRIAFDTDNYYLFSQYNGGSQLIRSAAATEIDGNRITTGSIDASSLRAGSVLTTSLFVGGEEFTLDGTNRILRISDERDQTRVLIGKTGDGPEGFGIEVRRSNGALILGADGLGVDVVTGDQVLNDSLPFDVIRANTTLTKSILVGEDENIIIDGFSDNIRVQDTQSQDRVIMGKLSNADETFAYGFRVFDNEGNLYFDISSESSFFVHDESIRNSIKNIGSFSTEPDPNASPVNSVYRNITNGALYINSYISGNSGPREWTVYLASPNTTGLIIIRASTIGFIFDGSSSFDPLNTSVRIDVRYDNLESPLDSRAVSLRRASDSSLITVNLTNIDIDNNLKPGTDANTVNFGTFAFDLNYSNFLATDFPVTVEIADANGSDTFTLYRIVGSTFRILTLDTSSFVFLFESISATAPTNTAITFSAVFQNLTSGLVAGDISVRDADGVVYAFSNLSTTAGSNGTATFDLTWATVQNAEFPLSVIVNKDGISDIITIQKLIGGNDAIAAYLTNEAHTVFANEIGVIPENGLATAIGRFEVFQGLGNVTSATSFSVESAEGVTAIIDSSSGDLAGNYQITRLFANQASVVFRADYNGVILRKQMSVTKAIAGTKGIDGEDGTSGVTIALTNEAHTFPADAEGNLLAGSSFANGNSEVIVYVGAVRFPYNASGAQNTFRFGNLVASGVIINQLLQPPFVGISSIVTDSGLLRIPVMVNVAGTTVNFDRIISYTRARRGAIGAKGDRGPPGSAGSPGIDGADGVTISLEATTQNIRYNSAGTEPSPITITITTQALNLSGTLFYEYFVNDVPVQNTQNNRLLFNSPNTSSQFPQKIEVQVRKDTVSGPIQARDQISIFGIQDGQDGVTISLSNEAHSVFQNKAGSIDFLGSGTDIRAFEGSVAIPYNPDLNTRPSFRVTSVASGVNSGNVSTVGPNIRRFANITAMPSNLGFIDFSIEVRNRAGIVSTFLRRQTFAKTIEGRDGIAGINGTNGTPGADGRQGLAGSPGIAGNPGLRGSKELFRSFSGAAWSSAEATQAFSEAGLLPLLVGDQVTLFNPNTNFAEKRTWSGSFWSTLAAIIPGSLLVRGSVTADSLAAGSVTATKIAANSITARNLSADFGIFEDYINVGDSNVVNDNTFIAGSRFSSSHRIWVGAIAPQNANFSVDKFGGVTARSLRIFDSSNELIFSSEGGFTPFARQQALIGSGALINPVIKAATQAFDVTFLGRTQVQYRLSIPRSSETVVWPQGAPEPGNPFSGSVNVRLSRRVKNQGAFQLVVNVNLIENIHYTTRQTFREPPSAGGGFSQGIGGGTDTGFVTYEIEGRSPFRTVGEGVVFPQTGTNSQTELIGVDGQAITYEYLLGGRARTVFIHDLDPGIGFIEGEDTIVGGGNQEIANASTLGGNGPAFYLNWNNLTNIPFNIAERFTSQGLMDVILANDGPNSTLNADLLDGFHANYFAIATHNHDSIYSRISHNHDSQYADISHNHSGVYSLINHSHSEFAAINHSHSEFAVANHSHGISTVLGLSNELNSKLNVSAFSGQEILARLRGVSGHGSGLNADLLDGIEASGFSLAGHIHLEYALSHGGRLTGNYQSDNPSITDNSDRIATTSFVNNYAQANFSRIGHDHSGQFSPLTHRHDTLYAALDHTHPEFSQLSGFARLESPAFTGQPTTTTPDINNNSTRIASTAFVKDIVTIASIEAGSLTLQEVVEELSGSLAGTPVSSNYGQRFTNGLV